MDEKYSSLLNTVREMVPAELMEKLKDAKGDVEFCKILADHGVDVEEIEKAVKNSGVDYGEIGIVLDQDELADVSGGWTEQVGDRDVVYACPWCGNGDRSETSRQFWATLGANIMSSQAVTVYRCKKCDQYWEMRQGSINKR